MSNTSTTTRAAAIQLLSDAHASYNSTARSMEQSAANRMRAAGINQPANTDGITLLDIEIAYNTALANKTLLGSTMSAAAYKMLGTKKANSLQRKLMTNKRAALPSTKK